MAIHITLNYKCPYCESKYELEEDADNCVASCTSETSEEIDVSYWKCSVCDKVYDDETLAETCEFKHRGDHPEQTKLEVE